MVLAHIVVVEKRFTVLEGRNHNGAGRRDLDEARRQAGKQPGDAARLVNVADELARIAFRPDVYGGIYTKWRRFGFRLITVR